MNATFAACKKELWKGESKHKRLCQGIMKKELAHQDARQIIELAGKTRETMQEFLRRATDRGIRGHS